MTVALSLNAMTRRQKLAVMESLWEDLTRAPENLESPAWHKDVLAERRRNVETGKSKFASWETAKTKIRKRVS